jgi:hypothetical protein
MADVYIVIDGKSISGNHYFVLYRDFAALEEISLRFSGVSAYALAFPPALHPAARPGAFEGTSSTSPVAMQPTMTAAELASVGALRPQDLSAAVAPMTKMVLI